MQSRAAFLKPGSEKLTSTKAPNTPRTHSRNSTCTNSTEILSSIKPNHKPIQEKIGRSQLINTHQLPWLPKKDHPKENKDTKLAS